MKRVLPLVELVWIDAQSGHHHSSWTEFEEFRDTTTHNAFTCHSVGYIVFENDERISLAAHLALHHPGDEPAVAECSGTFIIPKCCIVKRRDFK